MREPEVTCEKVGSCGIVTLNRPKALNALTLNMVREIAAALDRWENDAGVNSVIIRGMGDKAFCAGGDIRILYAAARPDVMPNNSASGVRNTGSIAASNSIPSLISPWWAGS